MIGAEIAARLVQQPINESLGADGMIVDADVVRSRVDLRAKFADDLAVDAHAPGGDQVVAMPPRSDSRMGQEFVEAFHKGNSRKCRLFSRDAFEPDPSASALPTLRGGLIVSPRILRWWSDPKRHRSTRGYIPSPRWGEDTDCHVLQHLHPLMPKRKRPRLDRFRKHLQCFDQAWVRAVEEGVAVGDVGWAVADGF